MKIHFKTGRKRELQGEILWDARCGSLLQEEHMTDDREKVTCRKCQMWMDKGQDRLQDDESDTPDTLD